MKDVEEFGITDEISVEEFIKFIAEEMYPAYTPFMNLFDNDKEKIKEQLRENLSCIKRIPEEKEEGTAGKYNITKKTIVFYSKNRIGIEDIRRSNNLKHIFVHESIHVIFSKARSKKQTICGCSYNGRKNRKVIRGVVKKFCRFEGGKGLLQDFINRERFYRMIDDTSVGDGLNEGFTVWLTEKIIGTTMEMDVYPIDKPFVEMINDLVGEEETLKISSGDYNTIANVLNMSKDELVFFLKCLDVASKGYERVYQLDGYEKQNDEIDATISVFDMFYNYAQFVFVIRFIIPVYEKIVQENGLDYKTLENFCCMVSMFKSIDNTIKFGREDYIPRSHETYKYLDESLRDKFIKYTNAADITSLKDNEVLGIIGMYSFLFKKNDASRLDDVDKVFMNKIEEKVNEIHTKRAINKKINSVPMEANVVSMDATISSILKMEDIRESERKAINRATRRAMKKQRKGNNQR